MRGSGRRTPLQVVLLLVGWGEGGREVSRGHHSPFAGLGAISLFDSLSTLPRTSVLSEEGSRELAVTRAC